MHTNGKPDQPMWFGVDSIALDRVGQWLYDAAVNSGELFRVRTEDLRKASMSDGLSTDDEGGIYVTDMEHSAVHRVGPDRQLETLVQDETLLRWPDGLGFGPDGLRRRVKDNAPCPILRFKPGWSAHPGN